MSLEKGTIQVDYYCVSCGRLCGVAQPFCMVGEFGSAEATYQRICQLLYVDPFCSKNCRSVHSYGKRMIHE